MDRTIIEGLQDIVSVLEDHLKPLVQAELSVLVDTLYRPEMLFPKGTEARRKCENGGFVGRLINHTSNLVGEKEVDLCVKILQTLREMMAVDVDYGEKVCSSWFNRVMLPAIMHWWALFHITVIVFISGWPIEVDSIAPVFWSSSLTSNGMSIDGCSRISWPWRKIHSSRTNDPICNPVPFRQSGCFETNCWSSC